MSDEPRMDPAQRFVALLVIIVLLLLVFGK